MLLLYALTQLYQVLGIGLPGYMIVFLRQCKYKLCIYISSITLINLFWTDVSWLLFVISCDHSELSNAYLDHVLLLGSLLIV